MKCFLFPTESIGNDKSGTFVLKDNNKNRIFVPIRLSTNNDCNDSITFSNSDLQMLAKEISNAFASNAIGKNTEIGTLNDFLLNQNKDLQSYIDNHVNGIPSLDDCLRSKDFMLITDQDLERSKKTPSTDSFELSNILLDQSMAFDLDFIRLFTTEFKQFRQDLGVTQTEVGQSMKYYLKSDFSQTTICRFESMILAPTNMFELIPYFRKWISKVYNPDKTQTVKNIISKLELVDISRVVKDECLKTENENASVNKDDYHSDESNDNEIVKIKSKTRKQRIQYTKLQLRKMENLFQTVKHTQITPHVYKKYAKELKLSEKQIRIWITKRRRNDRLHKNNTKTEKINL